MFGVWTADVLDDVGDGVIDAELAGLISLLALGAVLLALHVIVRWSQGPLPDKDDQSPEATMARRRSGLKSLVIGKDGRASTSKWQAVLWTFAVIYVFAFMLVWGRSSDCSATNTNRACVEARAGRTAFNNFVNTDLQSEYYVLMGFPITAALAAKALTTNKVISGTVVKPPLEGGEQGLTQSVSEIVGNDEGEADLLDAQYFAFTLLTLAFFAIEFFTHPAKGLPNLPQTLVALSGFSVAAYTTKKALETNVVDAAAPGETGDGG
jgi:hypothetical protein